MKRGLPRALMTDNGAAMLAEEIRLRTRPAGRRAPDDAAVQPVPERQAGDRSGAAVEGRLMAMLEGEQTLTLDLLNEATQAWVEQEYHRTVHSEIGVTPLSRYLAGPTVARQCPGSAALRDAFRIEVTRRAAPLRRHRQPGGLSLRDPRALSPPQRRPRALRPLGLEPRRPRRPAHRRHPVPDQAARQVRQRRRHSAARSTPSRRDLSPLPPSGMAPLLRELLAEYAATGLPPAYLPTPEPAAPRTTDQDPA